MHTRWKRSMSLSRIRPGLKESFLQLLNEKEDQLQEALEETGMLAFSLFEDEGMLYQYMEFTEEFPFLWSQSFAELLESWPGLTHAAESRYSVPMMNVFCDGFPIDPLSWRSNRLVEARHGAIARLRPNQYASYIFYHYQKQEELPSFFNQTYIIGAYEDILFSYCETPVAMDKEAVRPGKLGTNNTPMNWHEMMNPHFEPWIDDEKNEHLWRNVTLLYTYEPL